MLHMCVQGRHRARARQEEHLSQGTAQRQTLRPETPQKLGQQVIPSSGSFGEGGVFWATGHWESRVCVSIGMQVFIAASPECRTNAVCGKQASEDSASTYPSMGRQVLSTMLSSKPAFQRCLLHEASQVTSGFLQHQWWHTKLVLISWGGHIALWRSCTLHEILKRHLANWFLTWAPKLPDKT